MNKQEINIYREIQRNTEMAMKALDAVTDKIYDDRLAATVADQEMQYSRLHDRAVQKLVEGKTQIYRSNAIENMMLKMGIGYNTLLNTGTGHIAEMIIKGSNNGVLEMEKVLAHNEEMASLPHSPVPERQAGFPERGTPSGRPERLAYQGNHTGKSLCPQRNTFWHTTWQITSK